MINFHRDGESRPRMGRSWTVDIMLLSPIIPDAPGSCVRTHPMPYDRSKSEGVWTGM